MSDRKEKRKSFKDILRDSFPVNMDGLLGEQGGSHARQKPRPTDSIAVDLNSNGFTNTPPSEDTAPSPDTVTLEGTVSTVVTAPCPDTVPPVDTVLPQDTVPSLATVSPPGTVSSPATVPHDDTDLLFQHDSNAPRIELTSNYFRMDADVFDVLSVEQDAYERIVYGYLYRQSYGFNRQTCFVGLKSLVEGCQLSKNSVRRTLDRLEQKGHVKVVQRINERNAKGTVYRVYLPCEIPNLESSTTFGKQQ